MQNTELNGIRTLVYASNMLANNDEFYHRESDPLLTNEAEEEIQGK